MALTLYLHPLSSFCHKVLFGMYENGVEFESRTVNLPDEKFSQMSPYGKIPLLHDEGRGMMIPETTVMLEHVDYYYPGAERMFPDDRKACIEARLWDRNLDLYLHVPMQKIVGDRLRPEGERDPRGVDEARPVMRKTYDSLEERMSDGRKWILGDSLSVADCAAWPALFYGGILEPFAASRPALSDYFERLYARDSVKRLLSEARPFFKYFPYADKIPKRFL